MERSERIGDGKAAFLLCVALLTDGIQMLLTFLVIGFFVNWIFTIITATIFYLVLPPGVLNRMAFQRFIAPIAELVPLLNAFPIWTLYVFYIVAMDRWHHRPGATEKNDANDRTGYRL